MPAGPGAPGQPAAQGAFSVLVPGVALAGGRRVALRLAMTAEGPADGPAWLLLHGISGSHYALAGHAGLASDGGWAASWAGPGRLLDTRTQRVLTVNAPGSCYGSDWTADRTSDAAELDHVPIQASAGAIVAALAQLGVRRLAGVIGYSYGGYLAGRLLQDYPDVVPRALLICSGLTGRGGLAGLQSRRDLDDAEGRFQWRMAGLREHGLADWLADRDPAAAAAEQQRVRRWAGEFDRRAILHLRAAAEGHRLPALPPGGQLLLASSDRMFAPPDPLPAQARVVQTPYGHQSPLLDPSAWHDGIAAWLRTATHD